MSAEEEKDPAEETAAPVQSTPPAGGGSKITMLLTIVNLVLTLGIGAVVFLSYQKESKRSSVEDIAAGGSHEEKPAAGGHGGGHGGEEKGGSGASSISMVTLDPFTINLSPAGSMRPTFVRVNITVEMAHLDAESEFKTRMPQVRNTVIDLFNSKKPSDLVTTEGREYLRDEIKNALNSFMVSGKVRGVFFTHFNVSS